MKKYYTNPELEVIEFAKADVIATTDVITTSNQVVEQEKMNHEQGESSGVPYSVQCF